MGGQRMGGGEGRGLRRPQKQLLGRGIHKKTQQAPSSLIPPSGPLFSSSQSCCGLWAVPQPQAVDLASFGSWKVLGKDIQYFKILQSQSTWCPATLFFFS